MFSTWKVEFDVIQKGCDKVKNCGSKSCMSSARNWFYQMSRLHSSAECDAVPGKSLLVAPRNFTMKITTFGWGKCAELYRGSSHWTCKATILTIPGYISLQTTQYIRNATKVIYKNTICGKGVMTVCQTSCEFYVMSWCFGKININGLAEIRMSHWSKTRMKTQL